MHPQTCMKSVYNYVDYVILGSDKPYYFIVLYYDKSSNHINKYYYINNLIDFVYTAVTCETYLFGVWTFSHGNFVIHSVSPDKYFAYGSNVDVPVTSENNDLNKTFSFKRASDKGVGKTSRFPQYFGLQPIFVPADERTCVQSMYDRLQYMENTYNCMNDEYCRKENKFVIVLNLNQNRDRGHVYSYEKHLTDYHYKSVDCAGSIYGVWTFAYGWFALKSSKYNGYGEKPCTVDERNAREHVFGFDGTLIYTLNENTVTRIDGDGTIIIDFYSEGDPKTFTHHEYKNNTILYCSQFNDANNRNGLQPVGERRSTYRNVL